MNVQPFSQPTSGPTPNRRRDRSLALLLAILALLALTLTAAQACRAAKSPSLPA